MMSISGDEDDEIADSAPAPLPHTSQMRANRLHATKKDNAREHKASTTQWMAKGKPMRKTLNSHAAEKCAFDSPSAIPTSDCRWIESPHFVTNLSSHISSATFRRSFSVHYSHSAGIVASQEHDSFYRRIGNLKGK